MALLSCKEPERDSVKRVLEAAMAAHGETVFAMLTTGVRASTLSFAQGDSFIANDFAVYPNQWLRHVVQKKDGSVLVKVLTGSSGFWVEGGKVADLPASELQALAARRRENDAFDVFEVRSLEKVLQYRGRGEIGGEIVETVEQSGDSTQGRYRFRYSFSYETGLLAKKEKLLNQGNDARLVEQYFVDYRKVKGLSIPFEVKTYLNSDPYSLEKVESIDFGQPLDPHTFERPK